MNIQRTLEFGLMALVVALVVAAAPANAQQVYRATFDLPFEAQIGKNVLEPGPYTLLLEGFATQHVIRLLGAGQFLVLPLPPTSEPVTDNGRLTFVNVNGVYMLKKFEAGALGKSFVIPTFKAKGERAALETEPPTTSVVVATR